jgi:hypothetical protein
MIFWSPPPSHEEDATDALPFTAPKFIILKYTKEKEVQVTLHKSFQK